MKVTRINIAKGGLELEKELLPLLLGKVFHVTSKESFEKIRRSGAIYSNKDNSYPVNFPQSSYSFGTQRGMVCLIDLRKKSYSDAEEIAKGDYYFLQPKSDSQPVFLLLEPASYGNLKLQARSDPSLKGDNYITMEEIRGRIYVPEVECWYPEKITLDKISEVLIVTITHDQTNARILREIYKP